ncbi:hypothetical protein BCD48_20455 [Pseudofrankia sp. BMG5.36]|nr:hypothetical protein BCD48_20455 [Pseudofrankia sp. BMG5.36]
MTGCGLYGSDKVTVPSSSAAPAIRGADISTTLLDEAAGNVLSADGKEQPIERILVGAGANYVRLHLWIDPPPGYFDEETALTLARRATAAGMKIFLDLHYSDTWADPTLQQTPPVWRDLDLKELSDRVFDYTRKVVTDFARQGTPADMIQIGNELSSGFLWPLGKLDATAPGGGWLGFLTLLRSGVAGAQAGNPTGHRLSTAIHTARIGEPDAAHEFFDQISAAGIPFDVIALSYYPFWAGSMSQLRDTMIDLSSKYRKEIMVTETAYPWTLRGDRANLALKHRNQLPDADRFPPSPTGQAAYFAALRDLIAQVPEGRGVGFFAFEPGWLPGVGAHPGQDAAPYTNLTMFDYDGEALPSIKVAFAPPTN